MRITFDNGRGTQAGAFLSVHIGPGAGYMRKWWTRRDAGPGLATEPGRACGHVGLSHCNSAHCHRLWCSFPGTLLGRLVLAGHTLRLWAGPSYSRTRAGSWRSALRMLRQPLSASAQRRNEDASNMPPV